MNEDPIAAHLTELITDAPAPNHEEDNYDAGYVAALADLRNSAAFKLVVEQHANGRITELYEQRDNAIEAGLAAIDRAEKAEAKATELDWDELVGAIPDGWELWNTAKLERFSEEQERNRQAMTETIARWRARAEEAEATIARVEALRDNHRMHDYYGPGQPFVAVYDLRAALEGEQQ
ncbi:hypothetical protein [Rhodococcus erythropolis]|uniref:hypothetical protein n=1 Tax=Rhodococcus erythropolis TaxID=1833 RepID=UPI001BE651EF|nr:hypothetical protein [Rhodococcus erythropolis]MBT2265895.1 hypothetical protein [Rhodococcus erythropolis]